MTKWVALFSQTGSEISNLSRSINRWPDEIYTNNRDAEQWIHNIDTDRSKVKLTSANNIHALLANSDQPLFITLHGYLRIIPPELCEMHSIWNGHPAAIDLYPELKGKDPQERVIAGNYQFIGSVVHQCIPELDAGMIVSAVHRVNTCKNTEDVYNICKQTSLEAWESFIKEIGW